MRQNEILSVLSTDHGLTISLRTLQRRLQEHGLYRRLPSELDKAVSFIEEQVANSGLSGYRWMYTRCRQNGLLVTRDLVASILQIVDPDGITRRINRRLKRRKYFARGPNFLWHIDGYDKVKPYGIAIHGCIDGFSRKLIWLEAATTNNDPRLIGGYFMNAVEKLDGCPTIVRADCGTENGVTRDIQRYLRQTHTDDFGGDRSFLYGRSTANQRIEFLWGVLRRQCIQQWMDVLGNLKDEGHFAGDWVDKQLIQFCFMDAIQVSILHSELCST